MVRKWIPTAALAAGLMCVSAVSSAEEGEAKVKVQIAEPAAEVTLPQPVRAAIQQLGEGKVVIVSDAIEGEFKPAEGQAELLAKVTESKYWIGVVCDAIDDVLKAQLGVDAGLVVQDVVADGPASKAGVKKYDVLVDLEGQKLSSVEALVDAVEARGEKEAKVYFYRQGKEGTITITPAARPKPEGAKAADIEAINKQLHLKLRAVDDENKAFEMMIVRPGMAVPAHALKLPDDVTIKFTKKGDKPGEIEVKRGEKVWKATEDKLDELPDDLRPHVEAMRGAGGREIHGGMFSLPVQAAPAARETARMAIRAIPPGVTPHVVMSRPVPPTPGSASMPPMGGMKPQPVAPPVAVYAARTHGGSELAEVNAKLDALLKAVKGKNEVEKLQDEVERLRRDVDSLQRQLDRRDR
jgi:hypothetical protein